MTIFTTVMILCLIDTGTGDIVEVRTVRYEKPQDCVLALADVDQGMKDGHHYIRAMCVTPAGQDT